MAFLIDDLLAGAVVGKIFSDGADSLKSFLQRPPSQRLYRLLWHDFGDATSMSRSEFYAFAEDKDLECLINDLIAGRRLPDHATATAIASQIEPRLRAVTEDDRRTVASEMSDLILRGYPLATRDLNQQFASITTKLDSQHNATSSGITKLQSSVDRLLRSGDPQADLAAALVAGPLQHAGVNEIAERARELANAGEHVAAAHAFAEVGDALQGVQLTTVSETYRALAARQFKEAGDVASGLHLMEQVVWSQLDRGAESAWVSASAFEEMASGGWLAEGLSACANWPQQPWARTRLREAASQDEVKDRRLRWLAALSSVDIVLGHFGEALEDLAGDLPGLAPGPRLEIELDRLDATETIEGVEAADAIWDLLETWAATQPDPAVLGLCWQRRGYALARRGDLEGTRAAYRRAMAAWSTAPDQGEQVSDCLYSMQVAEQLLGIWTIDMELRPLAAALESSQPTYAARARRLQERAAANRIAENFREAHRDYMLAFAIHRRSGSLRGALQTAGQLAELYVATGHPDDALQAFVFAGREKPAKAVARNLTPAQIAIALQDAPARWERIVVYNVLETAGTEADPDLVKVLTKQLLEDASVDPSSLIGAGLADAAKRALAGVLLQLPVSALDAGIAQVRKDLRNELLISASQAAAQALMQATQTEVFDAREDLVRIFLCEPPIPRVQPHEIAAIVGDRLDLQERIADAATDGSRASALAALWASVGSESWMDVRPFATKLAQGAAKLETRTIETDGDGTTTVSHNMGVNFAPGGLAAGVAEPWAKNAFVEHVLAIIASDEEMEGARISAANGLFNCAEALTPDQREAAWQRLRPVSLGEYESTSFGSAVTDPLSAVRIGTTEVGMLQGLALQVLGRIWDLGVPAGLEELRHPTMQALSHPRASTRAAGVEVMRRVPELMDVERLQRLMEREEPEVRREAILALGRHAPETLRPHLRALASDRSRQIRWAVIDAATELRDSAALKIIAETDLDSYTRGLARKQLKVITTD